jgi:hypothetical protein
MSIGNLDGPFGGNDPDQRGPNSVGACFHLLDDLQLVKTVYAIWRKAVTVRRPNSATSMAPIAMKTAMVMRTLTM